MSSSPISETPPPVTQIPEIITLTLTPAPNGMYIETSKSMSPVEFGVITVALAVAIIAAGILVSVNGRTSK